MLRLLLAGVAIAIGCYIIFESNRRDGGEAIGWRVYVYVCVGLQVGGNGTYKCFASNERRQMRLNQPPE